jgi:hypothetical protein
VSEPIEFVDRYSATGTPRPDPATICEGHCEGMGCVPIYDKRGDPKASDPGHASLESEVEPRFVKLWEEAEAREPTDDGWHFVVCPDCNGTRLRPGVPIPEGWPPPVASGNGVA